MPSDFAEMMEKIIRQTWQEQASKAGYAPELIEKYGKQLSKAVTKGYGKEFFDVDWKTPDYEKLKALHIDAWKFASAKGNTKMQQLSDALRKPDGSMRTFEEFRAETVLITGKHLSGLKAEYNTAVASAQMASKWQAIQKQKDLYPYLEFVAVEDDHTSKLCNSLNGLVYHVDDAFWKKWYPPNHYNCRSNVKQLRKNPNTNSAEIIEPTVPEIFKTNLAANDLLFPSNHNYYKNTSIEVLNKYKRIFPEALQFDIEPIENNAKGITRVHFLTDKQGNDFERVLTAARELAKQGYVADVMPKINRKDPLYDVIFKKLIGTKYEKTNPDIRLNGSIFIEHEGFDTLSSKNAFKNMLNRGQKQSANIIIDNINLTLRYMTTNIKSRIKEGQKIENVWMLDGDKLVLIFPKTSKALD